MRNKTKWMLALGGLLAWSWLFTSCSQPTSDTSYSVASVAGTWTSSQTSNNFTMTDSLYFDGSGSFTETICYQGNILTSVSGTYTVSGTTIAMTADGKSATGSITSSTTMVANSATSEATITYTKK